MSDRLTAWIRELGPLRCVKHSGGVNLRRQAMALYFRTLEDAQACVAAFPEFELADSVGQVGYYLPGVGRWEKIGSSRQMTSPENAGSQSPST